MADHIDVISGLLADTRALASFSQLGRERAQRYRWATSAQSLAAEFATLL